MPSERPHGNRDVPHPYEQLHEQPSTVSELVQGFNRQLLISPPEYSAIATSGSPTTSERRVSLRSALDRLSAPGPSSVDESSSLRSTARRLLGSPEKKTPGPFEVERAHVNARVQFIQSDMQSRERGILTCERYINVMEGEVASMRGEGENWVLDQDQVHGLVEHYSTLDAYQGMLGSYKQELRSLKSELSNKFGTKKNKSGITQIFKQIDSCSKELKEGCNKSDVLESMQHRYKRVYWEATGRDIAADMVNRSFMMQQEDMGDTQVGELPEYDDGRSYGYRADDLLRREESGVPGIMPEPDLYTDEVNFDSD